MSDEELTEALADRDLQLPPLEQDRVAIRLGLVESGASEPDRATPQPDPVEALTELVAGSLTFWLDDREGPALVRRGQAELVVAALRSADPGLLARALPQVREAVARERPTTEPAVSLEVGREAATSVGGAASLAVRAGAREIEKSDAMHSLHCKERWVEDDRASWPVEVYSCSCGVKVGPERFDEHRDQARTIAALHAVATDPAVREALTEALRPLHEWPNGPLAAWMTAEGAARIITRCLSALDPEGEPCRPTS